MTAVLQPVDALRRDRSMASLDDSQINYSSGSADWQRKYNEVADMLAETRAELDDFHTSSKELEDELIKEIDRTEKAQQDLKVKVARTETERDEWKSRFMSLQTTFNTTTTSLQRELDRLRQEHQTVKVQLRDLEMGNDDLERNERAVSSTLADIESKYSRALEEKILLEHELLDKANLEEECQRLKDDLRDANEEVSIIKDQLISAQSHRNSIFMPETPTSTAPSSLFPQVDPSSSSAENLLNTPAPADLQLSELSPMTEEPPTETPRSKSITLNNAGQYALLQRAGFQPNKTYIPAGSSPSSIARSSTLPISSRIPPRTPPIPRPNLSIRNPSAASTSTTASSIIPGTASKSKGVQMVTEMRARVRMLEQKIHTRVPRIRMGSMSGRSNAANVPSSAMSTPYSPSSGTPISMMRSSSLRSKPVDDRTIKPTPTRRSADIESKAKRTPVADESGWVLIMEDSPSPAKNAEKERRRVSSPSAPTAFKLGASTSIASPTLQSDKSASLYKSTINTNIRRPLSRLSATSVSTTTTSSSIPTPSSRPSTPTFLPVPSGGLYSYSSTAGMSGFKRTTSTNSGAYSQPKRTSIGGSTATTPSPPSDIDSHARNRPFSYSSRHDRDEAPKDLPTLPSFNPNITIRAPSKASASSALSKSRIGRPSTNGRRSTGATSPLPDFDVFESLSDAPSRPRAGSAADGYSRNRF